MCRKFIFLRVEIISSVEKCLPPLLTFFSRYLYMSRERKHVRKWAFILSSLFRNTGLALKSVFMFLKRDSTCQRPPLSLMISGAASSRSVQMA